MADEVARRREARRRRILENAEERKKKIFGANSTHSPKEELPPSPTLSTPSPDEDSGHVGEPERTESSRLSAGGPQHPSTQPFPVLHPELLANRLGTTASLTNGTVPDLTEQLLNLNQLLMANGGGSLGQPGQTRVGQLGGAGLGTQTPTLPTSPPTPPSSPLAPVVLALTVCVLLSLGMGYMVSSSLALPFLLWEAHQVWRCQVLGGQGGSLGLMGVALMLCGVKQTTIAACSQVLALAHRFCHDLAFYLFTVVVWQVVVGLPGVVEQAAPAPDAPTPHHQPASHNVVEEPDAFDPLEDF